jgi:hypothetical protein
MKVQIEHNDYLPEGEYELTDRNKLENARGNLSSLSGVSNRQVLLEYDRIAGQITKNGEVLFPQTLWNIEKNRPIEQFTEEEIIAVLRRAENTDVPGGQYQRVRNEWQQRQQEQNLKQTALLINEVRALKDITKENAIIADQGTRNANKLSKYALWFAGASLLISVWQFILPIRFDIGHCYTGATSGDRITRMNCPNWIRIGEMLNLSWDRSYDVK